METLFILSNIRPCAPNFHLLSFGTEIRQSLSGSVCSIVFTSIYPDLWVCEQNCFCQSSMHVCTHKNIPRWGNGTPGRDATNRNVPPVNQMLLILLCWGGGGGGRGEIWNASILLMSKVSIWELRVLKQWNSDLRGKTKKEKQWKTASFCV